MSEKSALLAVEAFNDCTLNGLWTTSIIHNATLVNRYAATTASNQSGNTTIPRGSCLVIVRNVFGRPRVFKGVQELGWLERSFSPGRRCIWYSLSVLLRVGLSDVIASLPTPIV
jgi:hypothetical protein